ncbi:hypothetical protein F4810DRAFT_223987 [Camillea tinctor]|nr:hypothetical protein F4810DRAFT_223987 [Camillea tinctor]
MELFRNSTTKKKGRTNPEGGMVTHTDPAEPVADVIFALDLNSRLEKDNDLLRQSIGKARVLEFRYEHHVDTMSGLLSDQMIQGYKHSFLNCIKYKRQTAAEQTRPIVLIAHGFGGLVCEEFLTRPSSHAEGVQIRNLIHRVIFLSTPHYLAGLGEWASILLGRYTVPIERIKLLVRHRDYLDNICKMQTAFREQCVKDFGDKIVYIFPFPPRPESRMYISPEWTILPEFRWTPSTERLWVPDNTHYFCPSVRNYDIEKVMNDRGVTVLRRISVKR